MGNESIADYLDEADAETKSKTKHSDISSLPVARRVQAPASVDFGTDVVGSTHAHEAFQLRLPMGYEGTAVVMHSIEGDEAFEVATSYSRGFLSFQLGRGSAVKVRFAPTRSGQFRGTLVTQLVWADGASTRLDTKLTASAYSTTEVAPTHRDPSSRATNQVTAASGDPSAEITREDVPFESLVSVIDLGTIGQHRLRAIDDAKANAEAYKAPPPDTLLADLVGIAISVASAGLAGVAAHLVVGKLAKVLAKDAAEFAGTKVAALVTESSQTFITELIDPGKDHVKASATKALHATSTTKIASFFSSQKQIIIDDTATAQKTAVRLAQSAFKQVNDPSAIRKAFAEIGGSMTEMGRPSYAQQLSSSTQAWVSQVAQGIAGSRDADGSGPVTDLASGIGRPLATLPKGEAPAKEGLIQGEKQFARGILRIVADFSGPDLNVSPVKISAARIDGISRHSAERLASDALLGAKIPIRILARWSLNRDVMGNTTADHQAFLTRDEAGRIMLDGSTALPTTDDDAKSKANQHRVAAEIFHRCLSTSFTSQGVVIETDDASKD